MTEHDPDYVYAKAINSAYGSYHQKVDFAFDLYKREWTSLTAKQRYKFALEVAEEELEKDKFAAAMIYEKETE